MSDAIITMRNGLLKCACAVLAKSPFGARPSSWVQHWGWIYVLIRSRTHKKCPLPTLNPYCLSAAGAANTRYGWQYRVLAFDSCMAFV
jgi:hypothetical protein